jgi:hypothetical protein
MRISYARRIVLPLFFVVTFLNQVPAQTQNVYKINSPDGKISAELRADSTFSLAISFANQVLLKPSPIFMKFDKAENPGINPRITDVKFRKRNDSIASPFYVKRKLIRDQYNETEFIC